MPLLRTYISKSSLETWTNCGNKYLLSRILSYSEPPRKRTILGTAVHSIMEILANIKIKIQDGEERGVITNEDLGSVVWNKESYFKSEQLKDTEIDKINKSRINKQTYIGHQKLKTGHVRVGRDFVNSLINKAWDFYSQNTEIEKWNKNWEPIDKTELCNFTWLAIEGYDVRFSKIIAVEKEFDIPIEHEDCLLDNGEYVRIKGFIDIITEPFPGYLEILDWKTGNRSNLYTGDTYSLNDFEKDIQLCMYRYAVKRLYPEVKGVITSILYLRDGGLFTPEEIPNHDDYIFNVIKDHIKELRSCKEPKVFSENRDDFRCKHICWFARNKQFDDKKCDCQFIKEKVREIGLEETTRIYKNNGN